LYQSWVYISLVPHGCMSFVYKALNPYVTRSWQTSWEHCRKWRISQEVTIQDESFMLDIYIRLHLGKR